MDILIESNQKLCVWNFSHFETVLLIRQMVHLHFRFYKMFHEFRLYLNFPFETTASNKIQCTNLTLWIFRVGRWNGLYIFGVNWNEKREKKTDSMRVQSFCIKNKIIYSTENPKMAECLMTRSVIIHCCWEITLQNNTRKFSHKRPSHSRDIWMVFNLLPSFMHSFETTWMWGAFHTFDIYIALRLVHRVWFSIHSGAALIWNSFGEEWIHLKSLN